MEEDIKSFRHFNLNLKEKNVPPEMQLDSPPDMREKEVEKNWKRNRNFYGSKQQ